LLDKKQALIDHLQLLNDFMDSFTSLSQKNRKASEKDAKSAYQYQYAWILQQLERTNRELMFLLNYVRSRVRFIYFVKAILTYPKNLLATANAVDLTSNRPLSLQLKDYCLEEARKILVANRGMLPEFSPNSEVRDINERILTGTSLLIMIKSCVDQGLPPTDILTLVERLRPRSSSNMRLFENIQETIRYISSGLSSW
jgi:hypothetical protein